MRGYFVTGTDTGCGKTTVTAGILAALRHRGHRVAALKPVETGCELGADGVLVPSDGTLLRDACGNADLTLDLVVPRRFSEPVAPAVAARRSGRAFSIEQARTALARILRLGPELVLVEGAGGLLVPYAEDLLGADLAAALELPLLVVGRASLGTINHALLTIAEARRRNLRIAGVILSRALAERGPDEADNPSEIERLGNVRVLGTVAHLALPLRRRLDVLASVVERAFDPATLL